MASHHVFSKLETPCIGICSTIYGDDVCRGCFRSCQEVIDWNTYTDEQKLAILDTLNERITSLLKDKLEIFDEALLKSKCEQYNVKIRPTWHSLTWAHALLREGIHQIKTPENFGIRFLGIYQNMRIPQFVEKIDDEIYRVSHCAL